MALCYICQLVSDALVFFQLKTRAAKEDNP